MAMSNGSVMLRYALYRLQLAHTVGECILQLGVATRSSQMGEDLFNNIQQSES